MIIGASAIKEKCHDQGDHLSREVCQGLCSSLWIRHRNVDKILIYDSQEIGYEELLQLSGFTG